MYFWKRRIFSWDKKGENVIFVSKNWGEDILIHHQQSNSLRIFRTPLLFNALLPNNNKVQHLFSVNHAMVPIKIRWSKRTEQTKITQPSIFNRKTFQVEFTKFCLICTSTSPFSSARDKLTLLLKKDHQLLLLRIDQDTSKSVFYTTHSLV